VSFARFAVYEVATGRIDRIIGCPLACVTPSCRPGEAAVQVDTERDDTHFVDATVSYPVAAILVPFPARPSSAHNWDWTTKAWTL
jgi:hypothetical protein